MWCLLSSSSSSSSNNNNNNIIIKVALTLMLCVRCVRMCYVLGSVCCVLCNMCDGDTKQNKEKGNE